MVQNQRHPAPFQLAMTLWWRMFRAVIMPTIGIGFAGSLILVVLFVVLKSLKLAQMPLSLPLIGVGIFAMVGALFWVQIDVIRRKVFDRPVQIGGNTFNPVVLRDGAELSTPLPMAAAWGLYWGLIWRALLLGLPIRMVIVLLSAGAFSMATLNKPGALSIVISILLNITSFWWLISWSYGRTRITWSVSANAGTKES